MAGRRRATLPDDLFDLVAHCLERDAKAFESFRRDAFAFVDEAEENVLGSDVAVTQQPSFFLSQHHDPPGPVGEAFKHGENVSAWRSRKVTPNRPGGPTDLPASSGGTIFSSRTWPS